MSKIMSMNHGDYLFKQEIDVLSRITHPHIVSVNQLLQDEVNYYIVQELVTGGELFDYVMKMKMLSPCYRSWIYMYSSVLVRLQLSGKGLQRIGQERLGIIEMKVEKKIILKIEILI